jgi:hypothetical protein
VSSLASPLIGNTNVTNDRVAKFNHKLLNEELNRDLLQLDRSSPVKLLEESSGGPSSQPSPESPGLKEKILEEAKLQASPSPAKRVHKFSPSKPKYRQESHKARIGDSSESDEGRYTGFRLQKIGD